MHWSEIHTWPNAHLSRRVSGPVHRWHIQEAGEGPLLLLLHGAGASTHSMRGLMEQLKTGYRVVALDLPGMGFTQRGSRSRSGLEAMATDIAALAAQENWQPFALIGHSAGGAIALELTRHFSERFGEPPFVIGLNAALGEFEGLAGLLFPMMAKLLAVLPFSAHLFSGTANNPARVQSLIDATGSKISSEDQALYTRLVANRDHVDGALQMMAQWDLKPLLRTLPEHEGVVRFIVGSNDKTVPPRTSYAAAERMPNATVIEIDGLGHLAHEEDPVRVAEVIIEILTKPSEQT